MKLKTLLPRHLLPNAHIGFVAPSSAVPESRLEYIKASIPILEDYGFSVHMGQSLTAKDVFGTAAGTPGIRVSDLHNYFEDDRIGLIWCVQGGDASNQVLEYLDYDLIQANPKILVGFSDNVTLLNAIYAKTGLVSFVGPEPKVGKVDEAFSSQYTRERFEKMFRNFEEFEIPALGDRISLKNGSAQGPLIGGNLPSVMGLLGTSFMPDPTGAILMIEGLNVDLSTLIAKLTQLKQAGVMDKISGMIVADFYKFSRETQINENGKVVSIEEVILDCLKDYDFPILKIADLGHRQGGAFFPLGVELKMDTNLKSIKIVAIPFA